MDGGLVSKFGGVSFVKRTREGVRANPGRWINVLRLRLDSRFMNSRSDLGHTIPNRGLRFYNAKRYSGFDLGRPSYDQRHKNPPQSYTGHGGALVPHGGGLAGDSRAGAQMPQSPLLRVLREAQNIGNRKG